MVFLNFLLGTSIKLHADVWNYRQPIKYVFGAIKIEEQVHE